MESKKAENLFLNSCEADGIGGGWLPVSLSKRSSAR